MILLLNFPFDPIVIVDSVVDGANVAGARVAMDCGAERLVAGGTVCGCWVAGNSVGGGGAGEVDIAGCDCSAGAISFWTVTMISVIKRKTKVDLKCIVIIRFRVISSVF